MLYDYCWCRFDFFDEFFFPFINTNFGHRVDPIFSGISIYGAKSFCLPEILFGIFVPYRLYNFAMPNSTFLKIAFKSVFYS